VVLYQGGFSPTSVPLLEVEAGVARQRPSAQTRKLQFMPITRRTRAGMATDVDRGLFQFLDEAEWDLRRSRCQLVGHRVDDVLIDLLTRNYWRGLHPRETGVAALRTRSRWPSK
jgi:hypothetical protein